MPFLLIAIAGAAMAADPPIESWVIPGVGLRVTVPRGWEPAASPAAGTLMLGAPDGRGQLAILSGPLPAGDDGAPPIGLQEAADASLQSLRKSIRKFKLLARNEVELGSLPAVELAFKGRIGDVRFRWLQTLVVHADHQIIVMYAAPDDFYLHHLGDYDQLLRSLRPSD